MIYVACSDDSISEFDQIVDVWLQRYSIMEAPLSLVKRCKIILSVQLQW